MDHGSPPLGQAGIQTGIKEDARLEADCPGSHEPCQVMFALPASARPVRHDFHLDPGGGAPDHEGVTEGVVRVRKAAAMRSAASH